jgi:uncharacterized protein (DUF58 family)
MDFATGDRMTKMDYAICLAAALGYMMIHQQDAVGLAVFNDRVREFLPPRSKRTHLVNILGTLARTRPQGKTGLAAILHELAERIRRRGLIILLSDLLAEQAAVIDALHHLRFRGHDLILFQIFDHAERVLPFEGPTRFEDPESADTVAADPRAIRAAYIEAINRFVATYRRECQHVRADFVVVDNAMTFDKALIQFLAQRRGRF